MCDYFITFLSDLSKEGDRPFVRSPASNMDKIWGVQLTALELSWLGRIPLLCNHVVEIFILNNMTKRGKKARVQVPVVPDKIEWTNLEQ
jgi:hypothetical protein